MESPRKRKKSDALSRKVLASIKEIDIVPTVALFPDKIEEISHVITGFITVWSSGVFYRMKDGSIFMVVAIPQEKAKCFTTPIANTREKVWNPVFFNEDSLFSSSNFIEVYRDKKGTLIVNGTSVEERKGDEPDINKLLPYIPFIFVYQSPSDKNLLHMPLLWLKKPFLVYAVEKGADYVIEDGESIILKFPDGNPVVLEGEIVKTYAMQEKSRRSPSIFEKVEHRYTILGIRFPSDSVLMPSYKELLRRILLIRNKLDFYEEFYGYSCFSKTGKPLKLSVKVNLTEDNINNYPSFDTFYVATRFSETLNSQLIDSTSPISPSREVFKGVFWDSLIKLWEEIQLLHEEISVIHDNLVIKYSTDLSPDKQEVISLSRELMLKIDEMTDKVVKLILFLTEGKGNRKDVYELLSSAILMRLMASGRKKIEELVASRSVSFFKKYLVETLKKIEVLSKKVEKITL